MTDFKSGGVPNPDYDSEDINFVNQKTEFTDDVYVYGKLYADFGGDVQTFSTAGVERVRITKEGKVGIGSAIPTSGLQVNNFFRSQLEPPTLSQPQGANWATQSAIVTRGDFAGGICLDDNGVAGYSIFTSGNGNNLHIRAGLVGQVPVEKLLINSDSATDGKIKSLCQVVFYNVTQTQRDALTAQTGGVIYNSTTNKLQCWNGSSWNNLF